MWKTYKYIYYWLYTWQKKLWGEKDVPEFTAVCIMTLSSACNLASIALIVELCTNIQIIPPNIPKVEVVIFILLFLLLHYFVLMHNGRYLEIEKEFKQESKEEHKRKGVWVLLYDFGSLAFFIFLLFFGIWVKN